MPRKPYKKKKNNINYDEVDYSVHRTCTKCGVEKTLKDFTKDKYRADGFTSQCTNCRSKKFQEYNATNDYWNNYYQANKESEKSRKAKWVEANPDKVRQQGREWYKNNKERKAATSKAYVENNKESFKKYQREYRRQKKNDDELYKLADSIRSRMYIAFQQKSWRKNTSFRKYIGGDLKTVKKHIESQFDLLMNWDNHGDWHIDHKIPLMAANNENELIALAHYKNLQPMWATDNKIKSDSFTLSEKTLYLDWYRKNIQEEVSE